MSTPLDLAQSRLLLPSGLDLQGLDRAFGTLLGPGIDFGDLYFQHSRRESWTVEDGTGEAPSAPVFVDGEKTVTLRGDSIARDFLSIIDTYVERRYGTAALAEDAG